MRTFLLSLTLVALGATACTAQPSAQKTANNNNPNPTNTASMTTPAATASSIFDFTMTNIDGQAVPLSTYKGKVIVIVNTASECGLTPQYKSLQAFYDQYKDKGVVVLGFPANNFGGQEPGSETEIKSFCSKNYGVTFPMFAKISVKGADIHPLFAYLTDKNQNGKVGGAVQWNFQKFLIDQNGHVVDSFAPTTTVENKAFLKAVDELLGSK